MNGKHWTGGAFRALVGPEPLLRDRCLQACAGIGALSAGAASLVLFAATPPPGWTRAIQVQAAVGAVLLLGAAVSWVWPPLTRTYLLLVGMALAVLVAWYPLFMFQQLAQGHESGIKRFSHAPGVLALGLAFGLRLLVDFGVKDEPNRRRLARPAGIGGLVVGGCLDALVLYWMITMFLGA